MSLYGTGHSESQVSDTPGTSEAKCSALNQGSEVPSQHTCKASDSIWGKVYAFKCKCSGFVLRLVCMEQGLKYCCNSYTANKFENHIVKVVMGRIT